MEVPEKLCWTIAECALACGLSTVTIYRAIRSGKLRACQLGRKMFRILPEEAHAWLERSLVEQVTSPMEDFEAGSEDDSE